MGRFLLAGEDDDDESIELNEQSNVDNYCRNESFVRDHVNREEFHCERDQALVRYDGNHFGFRPKESNQQSSLENENGHSHGGRSDSSFFVVHHGDPHQYHEEMTRMNHWQGDGSLSTHPHAYFEEQQKRRSWWTWQTSIFFILLSLLVRRYSPPPPASLSTEQTVSIAPHENHQAFYSSPVVSWVDVFVSSGRHAADLFSSCAKVGQYFLSGLLLNAYVDVTGRLGSMGVLSDVMDDEKPTCSPLIPKPIITSNNESLVDSYRSVIEEYLLERVVGQHRAVRALASALEHWNNEIIGAPTSRSFVTILSGPVGVGKLETVRHLTALLFDHCDSMNNRTLLHIRGSDLMQTETATQFDTFGESAHNLIASPKGAENSGLEAMVLNHLKSNHGRGSVVVIEHLEKISDDALDSFYQLLEQCRLYIPDEDAMQNRNIDCSNVLFLLTTDRGTDKIFELIVRHGNVRNLPMDELTYSVREAVDALGRSSEGKFGKMANVIVPFLPLGYSELKDIMQQKVAVLSSRYTGRLWKRLEISDKAIEFISGPRFVNYRELRRGDSSLLVFAKNGAHPIAGENGALTNLLRDHVKRGTFDDPDSIVKLDHRPETQEWTLIWCIERKGNDVPSSQECEERWSGLI